MVPVSRLIRLGLIPTVLLPGCSSGYPLRDPRGELFPSVRGKTLAGTEVSLPAALKGKPAILLVGYEMNSQFDIDRWILGIAQAGIAAEVYEVPTIPGLLPGLFAGKIDAGMRSGIPSEDWARVITVYGDGAAIARFTGNRNPLPGRIILLDGEGKVAFFHDRGFSAGSLQALKAALDALPGAAPR